MSIETIPEGFMARLLNAFGLQWTHLVILSGVVFSSFHLESYLNPGIWILGTVASLASVYLFRHQVSGNFPRVAIWTGVSLVTLLIAPLLLLRYTHTDIVKFTTSHTELSTLYLSIAIGIPVGIAILSYRSQEEFLRSPLPEILANTINQSLNMSDFIQEKVDYVIDLIPRDDAHVALRFDVSMMIVNRSRRKSMYRDVFDPAGTERKFFYAGINGKDVNHEDPERLSERGLHLEYHAQPGEKFEVVVKGESTFNRRDSEMVGTYLACAKLSILIRRPPDDLRVNIQSWLSKKVDPKRLHSGDLLFEYTEGVLPFQGTRIVWEPQLTSQLGKTS